MSRIGKAPAGFQDLLGSVNFGDNPSDLSNVAQAIVEMYPFLASTNLVRAAATTVAAGPTAEAFLEVPQGEIWFVRFIASSMVAANVGDAFSLQVGLSEVTGSSIINLATSARFTAAVAAQRFQVSYTPSQLLPLTNSQNVRAAVENLSPVTGQIIAVHALYDRFTV